jgi:hypothetical protein
MVVSVGPYQFPTAAPHSSSRWANRRLSGSPTVINFSAGLPCQPASNNICQWEGVACIMVA